MDKNLITKYLEKQKVKVVENFDFDTSIISYSKTIKQNRDIKKISGNEEIVRAYLLTKLVNELGYKPANIEIEKEYTQSSIGRKKPEHRGRIDILVKDKDENPFLFIELKDPDKYREDDEDIEGQLFNLASEEEKKYKTNVKYLVYYTIETIDDDVFDKFILIDKNDIKTYDDWVEKGSISGSKELPYNYNKPKKELLKNNDLKVLDRIKLSQIRTKIHNTLWSAGVEDNEAYLFLVKYLLTKIYDETNTRPSEPLTCQIYDSDFENEKDFLDRINEKYVEALKEKLNYNANDWEDTGKILSTDRIRVKSLYFLVELLEEYSFSKSLKNQKEDILGAFFEETNREKFKQDKGQFFTHTNITNFIIYGLGLDRLAKELFENEKRLPYVIDPSAGSGTFLIELMKIITKEFKNIQQDDLTETEKQTLEKLFPKNKPNEWAETFLYGIDNSYSLAISTKVNMILHGDGSSKIIKNDGIANFQVYKKIKNSKLTEYNKSDPEIYGKNNDDFFVNEQFDAVVSNPPFSVNPTESTQERTKHFIFGDKKNSENLFIERWYQLLKPNGRFGVVLPESVYDTTENKYIRLFIYKYFKVKAVISLPQITFEPFTSTKVSLLFAQKKTKKEIEEWNKLWSKYSNEWNNLKTRCENLATVYLDEKERKKLPSIKDLTEKQEKDILARLLKDYMEENDKKLSSKELVEKYKDELKDLCRPDNDTKDTFGFVNTWWVFGEVAKEQNYKIFMAEVENIGYKRTKKGEKPMPNELYSLNDKGEVLVDAGAKETALDYLREVRWD